MYYTFTTRNLGIDEFLLNNAAKAISENEEEFSEYLTLGNKLAGIKALKEYTGLGLKESKQVMDLYYDGSIKISNKQEERRKKLEKLAKAPLVNKLISKLNNISDDDLQSLLLTLSVDELLSIDEFFPEENN